MADELLGCAHALTHIKDATAALLVAANDGDALKVMALLKRLSRSIEYCMTTLTNNVLRVR